MVRPSKAALLGLLIILAMAFRMQALPAFATAQTPTGTMAAALSGIPPELWTYCRYRVVRQVVLAEGTGTHSSAHHATAARSGGASLMRHRPPRPGVHHVGDGVAVVEPIGVGASAVTGDDHHGGG